MLLEEQNLSLGWQQQRYLSDWFPFVSDKYRSVLDKHATLAYAELRQVAGNMLALKSFGTLSPTGLVHEAFIKLARSKQAN